MEATKIETFADLDEYLRKHEILMHAHALAGEWAVELHSVPWHARVMGRGPTLLDALRDAVAKMEMPS